MPASSTVTIVPGTTSRMPDHTACPGDFTNDVANPYAGRVNPFPADPFNVPTSVAFVLPHNMFSYDPIMRNGTLHSWHVTLERELFPRYLVRAAYAGSRGSRLTILREVNAAMGGALDAIVEFEAADREEPVAAEVEA